MTARPRNASKQVAAIAFAAACLAFTSQARADHLVLACDLLVGAGAGTTTLHGGHACLPIIQGSLVVEAPHISSAPPSQERSFERDGEPDQSRDSSLLAASLKSLRGLKTKRSTPTVALPEEIQPRRTLAPIGLPSRWGPQRRPNPIRFFTLGPRAPPLRLFENGSLDSMFATDGGQS